jgi:two-component system chemotaxis response regulator CheB
MHRVLIVDDSATARLALRSAIERDPQLYVVGEADCGTEALALTRRHRPAVITMDVVMRRESGIDVAAAIMAEVPCPIVIVTACDTSDPRLAYQALQVGALELVSKLPSPHAADYAERTKALTRLLRNMAQVPVVHRIQRVAIAPNPRVEPAPPAVAECPRLVVVGASTGGPIRVRELLSALPKKLPVGIAVAQHIARGFGKGFASWLTEATGKRCLYVEKRTPIEPGTVYIAPDDADMVVDRLLYVAPQPPGSAYGVPNVDVLFQSAAAALGPAVLSVLMTGMGNDGAAGTAELARVGATTFVQEPKTCAVSSMPESAIRAARVSAVLEPAAIPSAIERLLRDRLAPNT